MFVEQDGEGIDWRGVSSSINQKSGGETKMKEELVIGAESLWDKDHDSCSRSHLHPHTCKPHDQDNIGIKARPRIQPMMFSSGHDESSY